MPTTRIAILPTTANLVHQAQVLAKQLHLPLATTPTTQYDYLLMLTPDYIGLKQVKSQSLPLYIDFLDKKIRYRCQHATLKNEALARALGLKKKIASKIVDATGGLAQDSFILATLGFDVTVLERSAIINVLLQDGLVRAEKDSTVASSLKHLHLIHADAIIWLQQLKELERPDLIYLDPMFPERTNSALVKKNMLIFQDIVGDDADADVLLTQALACAKQRVVVKRSRLSKPITHKVMPSFSLKGSSSRFDVYIK